MHFLLTALNDICSAGKIASLSVSALLKNSIWLLNSSFFAVWGGIPHRMELFISIKDNRNNKIISSPRKFLKF